MNEGMRFTREGPPAKLRFPAVFFKLDLHVHAQDAFGMSDWRGGARIRDAALRSPHTREPVTYLGV